MSELTRLNPNNGIVTQEWLDHAVGSVLDGSGEHSLKEYSGQFAARQKDGENAFIVVSVRKFTLAELVQHNAEGVRK